MDHRTRDGDDASTAPNRANYQPLTPVSFLVRAARVTPDHPAIVDGEQSWTYAAFLADSVRLAHALARAGVAPGDTVAVLPPNSRAVLLAHFAVPMLGAVLNCLNIRLDAATIGALLAHGRAKVLLVDPELGALADAALADLADPPVVVSTDQALDDLLAAADPHFAWPGIDDEWQTIALNYTSGTTGEPKGVLYHHRGAFLTAMANHLAFRLAPQPVYPWTLPMFHCNGWCNTWAITALMGTYVCLRRVEAAAVFEAIDRWGVTHMSGAPVVLNTLLNAPSGSGRRSTHRVHYTIGGAPPPRAILEKAEAIGFDVLHGYGLTETYGPCATCEWQRDWDDLDAADQAAKKQRQGVPTLTCEDVTVRDPATLEEVPADGVTLGELMVRGNGVMKGYLRAPEATARAFAGDWFHTGDLAVLHPDRYVEIKDRAKDIIISGGENISSVEVEGCLFRHPAVLEAAVVASPDERWGEVPVAFVALKADGPAADEAALIDWCKAHLARFKAPKRIVFRELPKTATGKVQKHVLRRLVSRPLEGADQR
ncbi:MAG: AMP-binding protein [Pseudomonadota bacterium]